MGTLRVVRRWCLGRQSDESGFALVAVLTALAAVSLLGGTMLSTTTHQLSMVGNGINDTKAFYAAEAGLSIALARLQENIQPADPQRSYSQGDLPSFESAGQADLPSGYAFEYWVESREDGYLITSRGHYGGRYRVLTQRIEIIVESHPAVISCAGKVEISGNADIHGDVVYGNDLELGGNAKITPPYCSIWNPDLELTLPELPDDVQFDVHSGKMKVSGNSTAEIKKSLHVEGDLDISGNGAVEFDTTGGDIYVQIDGDLKSGGNRDITITGDNRVYVHVKGEFKWSGNAACNPDSNPQKMTFYIHSNKANITGNTTFNGVIYSPYASMDIPGNVWFKGALYVGKNLNITGNSTMYQMDDNDDSSASILQLSHWSELR